MSVASPGKKKKSGQIEVSKNPTEWEMNFTETQSTWNLV